MAPNWQRVFLLIPDYFMCNIKVSCQEEAHGLQSHRCCGEQVSSVGGERGGAAWWCIYTVHTPQQGTVFLESPTSNARGWTDCRSEPDPCTRQHLACPITAHYQKCAEMSVSGRTVTVVTNTTTTGICMA